MSRSIKLKIIIRKFCFTSTLLLSVLLIFGCLIIFIKNNFVSFIFTLIIPVLLVLNLIFGIYWLFKKSKIFILPLLGTIAYFFCFDSFIQFNGLESSEFYETSSKSDTISILSYNNQGFKDDKITSFIKKINSDIFCVQEFSAIKYKYFSNYPYWIKTNIITPGKSVMGIFSKFPIVNTGYIDLKDTNNNAMFVDISYNDEVIRVYNLHLESYKVKHQLNTVKRFSDLIKKIGKAEIIRKEQAILVKNHIDKFPGKVIICGDFNSTQFSSTYNILKDLKKDSFIEAGFGFGKTYEFFKYPLRLDYFLVDDDFDVVSHQNFDLKFSDHEPVYTELVIN